MKSSAWRDVSLPPEASLTDAMRTLDATALQIVLVVDSSERLVGTVTDGDVRRALLRGAPLTTPISAHMTTRPTTVPSGTGEREALEVLRRMAIRSVPVVDESGVVTGLITLDELIQPQDHGVPVVIMAGGRGERLRPITDDTPKPLVTVGGQPLIEILVRRLVSQGFTQIWIAVHYRATDIQSLLGDGAELGATIAYIVEEVPLGTAGAVRGVPTPNPLSPILVCNADTVHGGDFSTVLETHKRLDAVGTMAVAEHITEVPFGVATVSGEVLVELVEKPVRRDLVAAGVNVVTPRLMALVENERVDIPELYRAALDQGLTVAVHPIDGYWLDVGTPETLRKAQSDHGGL